MKDSDFYLNKEILLVIKEALLQSIEQTLKKDDFLDNSPFQFLSPILFIPLSYL